MDEHTRVCIVGKSSSLSGKKLGSVIESHDLITRINFKDGDHDESLYLEDLGEKTHHIVAHPKVLRYYIKYAVDDLVKSLESIEDSEYGKKFSLLHTVRIFGILMGTIHLSIIDSQKNQKLNLDLQKRKKTDALEIFGVCAGT